MPEIPDFETIAKSLLLDTFDETFRPSGAPSDVLDRDVAQVVAVLRQVWNARGAADVETVTAAVMSLSGVYVGSAGVSLGTAIKDLDR